MVTVFGFYTNDRIYAKHAELLRASARKHNINIYLEEYNKDNWQSIIAFKPQFIYKIRNKIKGKLLYIDIDTIIHKNFEEYFENIKEDLAIHYLNNNELLSGTIFINDTPNAYSLVKNWKDNMLKNPNVWDQKILEQTINELKSQGLITIKNLPAEYTYIFDTSKKNLW